MNKQVMRVKIILGFVVHSIMDPHRYDPLRKIAIESGFDDIVVFTPSDVDFARETINGYVRSNGNWTRRPQPFPNISYDIGYYSETGLAQKMRKIKRHPKLPLIGYSIGNKWTIHRRLARSKSLRPYLIPTKLANNAKIVYDMIQKHRAVMLKPLNGSRGKGIVRIEKTKAGYERAEAEEGAIELLSPAQLKRELLARLRTRRYIVQKWIDIRDKDGFVYDIRSLAQKNKRGEWQIAGIGVRQADEQKMTSNLSDGGRVYHLKPFLIKQYGAPTAAKLFAKLEQLSEYLPVYLEKSYGRRLAELGLDLAIDRQQKIWIIEVNIKPGKTIMRKLNYVKADHEALRAPIEYARSLVNREDAKRLNV